MFTDDPLREYDSDSKDSQFVSKLRYFGEDVKYMKEIANKPLSPDSNDDRMDTGEESNLSIKKEPPLPTGDVPFKMDVNDGDSNGHSFEGGGDGGDDNDDDDDSGEGEVKDTDNDKVNPLVSAPTDSTSTTTVVSSLSSSLVADHGLQTSSSSSLSQADIKTEKLSCETKEDFVKTEPEDCFDSKKSDLGFQKTDSDSETRNADNKTVLKKEDDDEEEEEEEEDTGINDEDDDDDELSVDKRFSIKDETSNSAHAILGINKDSMSHVSPPFYLFFQAYWRAFGKWKIIP